MDSFHGHSPAHILIAPDKFKGSLTAGEATDAIEQGLLDAGYQGTICKLPLADGGEGTVEAFISNGAQPRTHQVEGPTGQQVQAQWAAWGEHAIVELAQCSGLGLVQGAPDPESAWRATTSGAGKLIRQIIDCGYRSLIIGVGGVAATDGGIGALQELGMRMLDGEGNEVDLLSMDDATELNVSGLRETLRGVQVVIASDVTHPLCGASGAAVTFAPQKGADAPTVARLARRLERWNHLLDQQAVNAWDGWTEPGTGAAGGFPSGIVALGLGAIRPGMDVVAEAVGLDEALQHADCVVVAEGKLDEQSLQGGKAPVAVAKRAGRWGCTVIAAAGVIEPDTAQLDAYGIHGHFDLQQDSKDLQDAQTHAAKYLTVAASRFFTQFLEPQDSKSSPVASG